MLSINSYNRRAEVSRTERFLSVAPSPSLAIRLALVSAVVFSALGVFDLSMQTSVAFAQDSDLRSRARKLTSEGQELQKAGEYENAEAKYRTAYKLIPHPTLLFNIAQVNRLAGKRVAAVRYYRQFVVIGQNDKLVAEARRHLAELEAQVGEIPDVDPSDGADSNDTPADSNSNPTDPKDQRAGAAAATAVEPRIGTIIREAPAKDEGKLLRISGVVAASVGVIAIGGGVYHGLRARRFSRDLSKTSPDAWTAAEIRKDRKGRDAERNMFVLTAVGGAAVATGVVLYIVGQKKDHPDSVAEIVPATDGETFSLVFSGRF